MQRNGQQEARYSLKDMVFDCPIFEIYESKEDIQKPCVRMDL